MKYRLLPCCLIYCLTGYSQHLQYVPDVYPLGGGAYSRNFFQSFSFLTNQASLAGIQRASVGLFTERRFGLKELGMQAGTVVLPLQGGGLGVAIRYAGFRHFNQGGLSLAYGRSLGRVDVGVQWNYSRLSMTGYGNDAAMGFELSTRWQLSSKLMAGIRLANPVGGRFRRAKDEKLASVYVFGLGYEASEQVLISMETVKEEDRPLNVVATVQYSTMNKLFMRLGVSSGVGELFLALGWKWQSCRVDVLLRWHRVLGPSPGLVIGWEGKDTE